MMGTVKRKGVNRWVGGCMGGGMGRRLCVSILS